MAREYHAAIALANLAPRACRRGGDQPRCLKKKTMLRQWNSLSEDWETTLSTTSTSALALSQRVIVSPSSSRSLALVAEKTFTPVKCIASSSGPGHAAPRRDPRNG